MKLKYYMRGLGIGILITTIILTIGGKKEKLSDKEIMARAGELGMVMMDENKNNDNLEEVLEKTLDKDDKGQLVADEGYFDLSEEGTDGEVSDVSDEDTDSEEPGLSDEGTDGEVSDVSDEDTDSEELGLSDEIIDSEEPDRSDDMESEEEVLTEITFSIVRGMSSRQVAELLKQKGLVDDAIEFDDFIKQKGKARVIRIGTYTLTKGSSYQAILDTIAG